MNVVRVLGSALLGLLMVGVLVLVEFVAGLLLLPRIPGTECGWLICGEDRMPTLMEWIVYSVVACAVISLPAWGVFVVVGVKPLWRAYLAGLALTLVAHLMLVIDILPAVDPNSATSDLTLPVLTALWVFVPTLAAVAVWRLGSGHATGNR